MAIAGGERTVSAKAEAKEAAPMYMDNVSDVLDGVDRKVSEGRGTCGGCRGYVVLSGDESRLVCTFDP